MVEEDSAVSIVNVALQLNKERSKFPRFTLHAQGVLLVGDATIPCEVENISLGGAYVTLDSPIDVSTPVILTIFASPRFGALSCVRAKVIWVTGNGLGLQFE